MALHPDTNNLFVVDELNKNVGQYNVLTGEFLGVFGETGQSLIAPVDLDFHPDTHNLFVSDTTHGDVREFDGTTGALIGTFGDAGDFLVTPGWIAFHPVTHNLLVSDSSLKEIREFRASDGDFVKTLLSASTIIGDIDFHPVTGNLLVPEEKDGKIAVINPNTGAFISSFGDTPTRLAIPNEMEFNPITGNLLVTEKSPTSSLFNSVLEFDGTNGAFVSEFLSSSVDPLDNISGIIFNPFNTQPVSLDTQIFNEDKSHRVVSPYWQADSGSYTFLAVSHPSLTGMNSRIGVSVHAVLDDLSGVYGPSVDFTLTPNETRKIFIASFDNATVKPTAFPKDLFITGSSTASNGLLTFNPVASHPEMQAGPATVQGRGYPDITRLNFWGAVIIQESTTGFAMEFIGDTQDSRGFNTPHFSGVN